MVDKFRKIFFVFAIVAISLMGMPVHTAKAATVSAGSLIKASGAAVYYYASNGKRFVFPNEKTYMTWFSDFSSVVTITDAELAAIQIGGNIVYRPGTRLVKITTDPKVYAVSAHGTLHWITSESIANQLYGATWNQMIDDVSDAFFTNYTYGADVTSAVHPDGAQIKYAGSAHIYVIEGGEKRLIADAAVYSANRFNGAFVMNIADTIVYPSAVASLAAAEVRYTDVAQLWGTSTPVVTGNLNITVASDTPASTTVPQGAVGVAVAKFTFTAGPNAVTIDGLTLTRSGLGQATEIAKVYLYNGDSKLSSGRTINTSTNTVNFTNLGLSIPANGSVTVTVKVDIGTAALGGSHRFGVAGVGDVTSSAAVGGIFPVNTNEFAISTAVTVGKADVESNGTTNYTRKVGETEVEVANFTVYVNNVENGRVESVTLYNSGRDILSNLKLYRGTTLVATGVKNGNYFTFNLTTPYEIAKSESAQFIVKGDISGREGDTATLNIRYKTDVRIKGMTYGYALDIDPTINTADSYVEEVDNTPQSNTTTAEAGQLTAAFNGPVTGNVAKNTTNVVLMNFSLTAQSAVDVEKSTITISGNSELNFDAGIDGIYGTGDDVANVEMDDLKLVCNNVVVAEWSTVTKGDNVSTDMWNLPAGGVNCQVRIDVLNTTAGNETIKATLKSLTGAGWTFKDAATGDALTDIVPSGDIAGNVMSITAASLTVDLASSPSTGNIYVPRSADAQMVAFLLTAGAASDVKVTSMKLAAYLDDDQDWNDVNDYNQSSGAKDILSTVKLYNEEGTQIGTTKTLVVGTTDITATFDNLSFVIPAGTTKKVLVKADISSTAPMSADDYVAFALSTITAEYGTGGTSLTAAINADNSDDASVPGTTPSIYQTVTTSGDLTVSLHADTPAARLLPMNTGNLQVLRVKLAATKEAITLNDLAIVHDPYNVLAYNEIASASIGTKTAYFVDDGAERVAKFTGLNINVPADSSTYIDVLVRTNDRWSAQNYDNTNSFANQFYVSLNYYKHTTAISGVVDSTWAGSAVGKEMYVFEAYPSFVVSTASGTLSANIDQQIGQFTVTANGAKDVTFVSGGTNRITLSINVSGATALQTPTVKVKSGSELLCSGATPALPVNGTVSFLCLFNDNALTVAANSSKTLTVYLDTVAAGLADAANESASISLTNASQAIRWSIDGVGTWTDVGAGTEIINILLSGVLSGGTYSN